MTYRGPSHGGQLLKANITKNLFATFLLLSTAFGAIAQEATGNAKDFHSLDDDVRALKKDVLEINRELFSLEEDLLYPTNTQVSVFLSLDIGKFFKMDAVQVKIDGRTVSNHLYTQRELDALRRGGIHRVYLGNLPTGEHELVALFTGLGPQGQEYRRGATTKFEKGTGSKYLELKVLDMEGRQQPDFQIKVWD